jgi:hypothetical protein
MAESDEAEFCLSRLAAQQEEVAAAVAVSWRTVPIGTALAFIDSGDADWEGAACDAFALAGMLGRTEWGRELEDESSLSSEEEEEMEEGKVAVAVQHAGESAMMIPALDRPRRLCSWLLKTMAGSGNFDNHILGFRVYVHADFRATVSSLFGCENKRDVAHRRIDATVEGQCLIEWRAIWRPSQDDDGDLAKDDILLDQSFHDIPLEHLTMHASAPLRRLAALDPDTFERWNTLGCDAFVASALTLAESRREDDGPCDAEGLALQQCIEQENWRLTHGLQIVDVCFPCGSSTTTTTTARSQRQQRQQHPDAIQKLCDPQAYRDSTPIFPATAASGKEEFVVKGGFIPGATNIALFFETQLVMAMLTKRVLVLPPRGGLVDHLYASGPVDYLVGRWTRRGISRTLNHNQQTWSWPKFVSVMLRRLRQSSFQHHAMQWRSSVSMPLVPHMRTISLLRWTGRQFYRGSDFSSKDGLNSTAWPLDNLEEFHDEILHVVGGGTTWFDTLKLSAETQARVEASLVQFRKPFRIMRGLVDAAVKSIAASSDRDPSFKAVQLRLGDLDSMTRQMLPDTAAVIAELTKFGFMAHDRVYLATDDNPGAPFLDSKLLSSAFPNLMRRQDLDVLGQECLDPTAPPLPASSEQETIVSPWSQQNNVNLEGPRCVALEQAICARATIWVGTRWSSFGPRIGILRAARGKESLWFTEAIGHDESTPEGASEERTDLLRREREKEYAQAKKLERTRRREMKEKESGSSFLRSGYRR